MLRKSDYDDVVEERALQNRCGYPVCHKEPSKLWPRGKYKLNLAEKAVIDITDLKVTVLRPVVLYAVVFGFQGA